MNRYVDRYFGFNSYKEYLESEHWQRFRLLVLDAKEARTDSGMKLGYWICEHCGDRITNPHIHHKHYNTIGNEQGDDLEVLCPDCHRKHHGK